MKHLQPKNIEGRFTSKDEIDEWYSSTADGYSKLAASIIEGHGMRGFNENYGNYIHLALLYLNHSKDSAYQKVLKRRPNPDELIDFASMIKKYTTNMSSDPNQSE